MAKPYIKLLRPHHWTKNVFCLAGLVFGGGFRHSDLILRAVICFAAFCAISSATYIFNDINDRERDRLHSKKRFRPIAAGTVGIPAGIFTAVLLLLAGLTSAWYLGYAVCVCIVAYLLTNLAYTIQLKHRPLIDVNCIAIGFVLRMLAGVYAVNDIPTTWIVLCTFTLSLLLATAKRRSELVTLSTSEIRQRPVLARYNVAFLDSMMNSTATVTVICYALFAVLSGKNTTLVVTVPLVYYGVMRYTLLAMTGVEAEEPEKIVLRDRPIQLSVIFWMLLYLTIIANNLQLFRNASPIEP